MKASYAALLSIALAFSAYRGTNSIRTDSISRESKHSASVQEPKPTHLPVSSSILKFPTIGGGMCQLEIDGKATKPCACPDGICPAKDLTGLISEYFRGDRGSDQDYLEKHWQVPKVRQDHIRFVISTVPDPVHTHMALLFDRRIEIIQNAAQANGFLFSRAWMPWDISTHNESADFTVRMAQESLREAQESLPGLLIFQKADRQQVGEEQILFVFVVGETPTGGIRAEQFQNALNIRKTILTGSAPCRPMTGEFCEAGTLRVHGPTFSGSLRTMDAILKAQPDEDFYRVLIRSGTVSSSSAIQEFNNAIAAETVARPTKTRPDFATFNFSDKYQEHFLGKFLWGDERNSCHSRIAILSEDETAFGNQEEQLFKGPAEAAVPDDPCKLNPQSEFPYVRLYFPREIAQLRDAYQRDAKALSGSSNSKIQLQTGLSQH